ncbi:MAG: hypothetical protein BWY47_02087 [Bacteroidetes bacterium ADurb.Bin302]|nr:MAG: hypothetical protein BWY47_02087 [Bacteroidetes bacterium ADurb.Bin302]
MESLRFSSLIVVSVLSNDSVIDLSFFLNIFQEEKSIHFLIAGSAETKAIMQNINITPTRSNTKPVFPITPLKNAAMAFPWFPPNLIYGMASISGKTNPNATEIHIVKNTQTINCLKREYCLVGLTNL